MTVRNGLMVAAMAALLATTAACSKDAADGNLAPQAGVAGAPDGQAGRPGGAAGGGQRGQVGQAAGGGRPGGGGPGGGFGGGGFRPPMSVEVGTPTTGDISAQLNIVGNLIGEATVDVVPRTAGRLVSVNVKLGDRVTRGQLIAKIEDQEVNEQVKQAEASYAVAQATIRQREADLKFAEINLERSKNLFERQLLPRQSLDDAEARQSASAAQLDLSRAQFSQAEARLEELRIAKGNTNIVSPVNGFVGKRNADPGAWASSQTPVVSVVDISSVRLVANVVERDLRLVNTGDPALVEVDAFPGESFKGRIARVAPVLDPATRTAEIEIEVPNAGFRLKPGMYARMSVTIESRTGATLVPKSSIVDYDGKRGVFTMTSDNKAQFVPIEIGIEDENHVEARSGVASSDTFVTGGASSLRNGDTLVLAGRRGGPGARTGGGAGGAPGERRGGPAAPAAAAPAPGDAAAPPGAARKRPDAPPGP